MQTQIRHQRTLPPLSCCRRAPPRCSASARRAPRAHPKARCHAAALALRAAACTLLCVAAPDPQMRSCAPVRKDPDPQMRSGRGESRWEHTLSRACCRAAETARRDQQPRCSGGSTPSCSRATGSRCSALRGACTPAASPDSQSTPRK